MGSGEFEKSCAVEPCRNREHTFDLDTMLAEQESYWNILDQLDGMRADTF